ncbi:MAG TPA: FecR domain-containing protein [Leptospiraceae bacterium]|nr:FecR domain-containing protein [Leptospirales bacterium]HMU85040.1 FecR domain-containing protein [Leptospiraceae bacterium]HMW58588.1 FecR domain-containing protein [Leptospiraceae bacterium]HMX55272.1 FecR domain-containing protein [Leptospiraceae bacterium]HMY47222.1 FecR domain-containing protein [Leptospiraceae bacterium]
MKIVQTLTAIVFTSVVCYCGYKPSEAAKTSMLIVFVTGDAFVVSQNKPEVPATVGMIVRENDVIRTESGSVDLQTVHGNAVRIREMTTLTVAAIHSKGETKLGLKNGAVLAKVQKASKEESFIISTPTAVAGVRGTTFSVEIGPDARSSVRVIDGKVGLAPRVAILESMTPEQIKADPTLQKLSTLQSQETVLEDKTQGTLNANLEKQLIRVSETRKPEEIKAEQSVETKTVEIPIRELAESRTLVSVKPQLMDRAIKGDAQAVQEIQSEREMAKERALDQIMKDASTIELKSEDAIRTRYSRFELITLNSGEKIRGAVIAQTDSSLVVHTTSGVRKIPRAELNFQEPL